MMRKPDAKPTTRKPRAAHVPDHIDMTYAAAIEAACDIEAESIKSAKETRQAAVAKAAHARDLARVEAKASAREAKLQKEKNPTPDMLADPPAQVEAE